MKIVPILEEELEALESLERELCNEETRLERELREDEADEGLLFPLEETSERFELADLRQLEKPRSCR